MAASLQAMGWPPGSRIAISGRNCAHWIMADLAIQWAGHVSVGLYPRQLHATTDYILQHSGAVALFLGPGSDDIASACGEEDSPLLIRLPYVDTPAGDLNWQNMRDAGGHPVPPRRPLPENLMTLIYTSGTTGNPKGVMIGYGALAWTAQAFLNQLPPSGPDERLFSYLPLAHLLERATVELASLLWRAEIHFLESPTHFATQLRATAPTRFFAVPLIWQRLQSAVLERLPQSRLDLLLALPGVRPLLQRYLRRQLGLQNLRMAVSGAAPIAPTTLRWLQRTLGLHVQEGYGMTENCGYVSLMNARTLRPGSVGKPFTDAGLRLSDEGEIQINHPGVMLGYYRDDESTRAAFTADGWLKTGDLGRLDRDGLLYITGRIKDIFKTAKGKYVAPAPIEQALAGIEGIDQACVLGSNLRQPVAVVTLTAAARQDNPARLQACLAAALARLNATLEEHARLSHLLIVHDNWTIDNGLLTPTLKIRRAQIELRYEPAFAQHMQIAARTDKPMILWE